MTLFIYYFCQNEFGNIIFAIFFKKFANIFVKINLIILHFKKINKNEEL